MAHEPAITFDFGSHLGTALLASSRREWLVTNGIGGYGLGTLCNAPTRGYHGLLIAALQPPVKRTLMLAKLDETLRYGGQQYDLFTNHWASGLIEPRGFEWMLGFRLEGTTPVWTFTCADALIEKRVWMQHGANTTYITYRLLRASQEVDLSIKALVTYRDHHHNGRDNTWRMTIDPVAHGLRLQRQPDMLPFYLLSEDAPLKPEHQWYRDYYLAAEAYRGIVANESYLHAAQLDCTLAAGDSITLVASTEAAPVLDGDVAYAQRRVYEQRLLDGALPNLPPASPALEHLILAADQFVVCRPHSDAPDGYSVIAGYPWFSDWGRDTMISLPGLTLTTGRYDVARGILRTFSEHVDQGMLPNRFPDEGEAPEYNTVDAVLWYFEAIRAYHAATGDTSLLAELYPVLKDIIAWHRRGTRYNIHLDPNDALLYAGEPGIQLTWMDAKVGDWVITPRIGKPVEVNALWYNALRALAGFARALEKQDDAQTYDELADRVRMSFERFWRPDHNYCWDVLDGPGGHEGALRPNQIFAVSLHHSPLPEERQRAVVDICARRLLAPYGLRSLSPDHPQYVGEYGGDQRQRDAAYHQGVVWGWLLGPFVSAHLRVYQDPDLARSFLYPMLYQLTDHCVGNLSEIFDGDPPHHPRGCVAQAWTVAEVLRAWQDIERVAG